VKRTTFNEIKRCVQQADLAHVAAGEDLKHTEGDAYLIATTLLAIDWRLKAFTTAFIDHEEECGIEEDDDHATD
jgi:hypothetical protein